MTSTTSLYRRVLRRETHAARATPAIIVAVLAIIALAWLGTECVLAAIGQHALLLSPAAMVTDIAGLAAVAAGTLIAIAAGVAVVGLILLLIGLSAGRLARHTLPSDRAAIVVHDEMIASALVRYAAAAASTDPDRAVAGVGRRRAVVRLTPTTGTAIDTDSVSSDLTERLQQYALKPRLKARVVVMKQGKVGA